MFLLAVPLSADLFKAKGYNIGDSIHSDQDFGFAEMLANPKLLLPIDLVVASGVDKKVTKLASELQNGDQSWDSGAQTLAMLPNTLKKPNLFVEWPARPI